MSSEDPGGIVCVVQPQLPELRQRLAQWLPGTGGPRSCTGLSCLASSRDNDMMRIL